jgi:hydrophobic/amphiphilic exporter-1 (mainly G- bacteria), HAE1 family
VLPARALASIVAIPRAAFFLFLRALHAASRLALVALTPVRWPLAFAALILAAWQAVRAWPALRASEELTRAGLLAQSLPFDPRALGWVGLLYALPAAAGAVILLLLVPRWRARLGGPPARPERFVPAGDSVIGLVIASNRALIEWTMDNRRTACLLAFLGVLSIAVPKSRMTVSKFGQEEDKTRINVYVDFQDDFTLAQASEEMENYERFLESRRERYGLEHVGARFSAQNGRFTLFWAAPQKSAHLESVNADLRANLPRLAGHKLRFVGDDEGQSGQAPSRTTAVFRLLGPDSEELERLGAHAITLLERVPGVSSLSSPLETAPPQIRVQLDADLAQRLGVSATTALQNISWVLRGAPLPRYQESGREVPLIIEYDEEQVAGLDTLRDLDVYTAQSAVPLSSFSELEFGRGSRSIYRHDGQATFTIEAKVDNPARLSEVSEQALAALRTIELPRGYSIDDRDSALSRQQEEFKELFAALLLSVVLVFLLMGILFESFLLPVSVLFTIPYAVVGSYWTLYLTGTAMDSIGWIGIIILVGVVVNNGIVLIDRIHNLVGLGWERKAAVVEGCANRVRPILMTALTSVIGLWPMAVTEPPGQGIDYRALATCVAGGLVLSTFFTLWVVPLAYTILDDLSRATSAHFLWALRPLRRRASLAPAVGPEPRPS